MVGTITGEKWLERSLERNGWNYHWREMVGTITGDALRFCNSGILTLSFLFLDK
jgi:hypothetical protein